MPEPSPLSGFPKPVPAPSPTTPPPTPSNTPVPTVSPTPQSTPPICDVPQTGTPAPQELPTPSGSTVEAPTAEGTPAAPAEDLPAPENEEQSMGSDPSATQIPTAVPSPVPAPAPTLPQPIGARKQSIVLIYSVAPDVCVMPNSSVACFDLVAIGTDAVNESRDVFANNAGVIKLDTTLLLCSGDEPAAAGSLSGTIKNIVEMVPNGCRVISNKKVIIRDNDLCTMNNKNTIGIVTIVDEPLEDSGDPLDDVKRASDVLEGYKDAADGSDKADADAKKAERGTGRGKRKKNRQESPRAQKDRAKARAQKKADLEKARARARKLEVPGKGSKLGKLARKVPGLGDAIDVIQVGEEAIDGNYGKAADKVAGIGAGKLAAIVAGAACIASGPGALICAGVAIGADWIVGDIVEDAGIFGGERQATQSPSPNPTVPPIQNGIPTPGGSSAPALPATTPMPQPAPKPRPSASS